MTNDRDAGEARFGQHTSAARAKVPTAAPDSRAADAAATSARGRRVLASAPRRPAHADGTLTMRGVYYKERATRVDAADARRHVRGRRARPRHRRTSSSTRSRRRRRRSGAADAASRSPSTATRAASATRTSSTALIDASRGDGEVLDGVRLHVDLRRRPRRGRARAEERACSASAAASQLRHDQRRRGAQGPSMPTLRVRRRGDAGERRSARSTSYSMFASASQIVSPQRGGRRHATTSPTLRRLPVEPVPPGDRRRRRRCAERHPTERTAPGVRRLGALLRRAAPSTTFIGAYRYYRDDWKIHAHTPELRDRPGGRRRRRRVGPLPLLHARTARSSSRSATPDDDAMTPYVSDDVKLSTLHEPHRRGQARRPRRGVRARRAAGQAPGSRASSQYVVQHNRFGNAVIAHVALTVPFDY